MEAAFPCHQSFEPCTENCPHPRGSPARSSHQTMQLQELQRLRTVQETQLGRPGPHRSPTLWNTFSVQGVVREPWGSVIIFICKQTSQVMSTWPRGCEGASTLALNFSHDWKANGCQDGTNPNGLPLPHHVGWVPHRGHKDREWGLDSVSPSPPATKTSPTLHHLKPSSVVPPD